MKEKMSAKKLNVFGGYHHRPIVFEELLQTAVHADVVVPHFLGHGLQHDDVVEQRTPVHLKPCVEKQSW
jgi:hypothetical protein